MDPTSEVEVRMKKLSTGRLPSLDASGPRSCLGSCLAVRFVASAALLTPEASAWLISCAKARRLPAHRVAPPLAAVSHSMLTQFTYGLRFAMIRLWRIGWPVHAFSQRKFRNV